MVEIGGHPETLVEVALRLLAFGRDRIGQRTEIVPERRLCLLVCLHRLGGLDLGRNVGDETMRGCRNFHGNFGFSRTKIGCRRTSTQTDEDNRRQSCGLQET